KHDILQNIQHDILTGLPDNSRFYECIKEITKQDDKWIILVFSINNFKHFNDLFSYSFGNKILDTFAVKIKNILPVNAQLFRLDGNGFGILAHNEDSDFIINLYQRINALAHSTHTIDGMNISFDISAGVCQYPKDGINNDILYRNARIALSYAKSRSQDQCVLYQEEMAEKAERDMLLLEDMRYSVEHNFEGFSLVYQPIVHADSKELFGCEALLRYKSPSFENGITPFVFIPILENSGLIMEVGKWVIDNAFKQCQLWRQVLPDFQMNVNVSARQFDKDDFPDYVINTLHKYNLNPQAITLELTESEPAQFELVNKAFYILRKQGIKTAFDDFGTGYASLDIFRSISGDELKIDKSFLERITYDVTDQVLLKSIIEMCHTMKIVSCVEGIETPETEHVISQLKPDLLQGYLYSRPITSKEFEDKYLVDLTFKHEEKNLENDNRSALAYTKLRPAKPMSMSAIVDNAYAGIIQVGMDDNFTLLSCNEGYRRMLGYSAKEIEERFANQALGFVHPDDIEWVNEEVRRQLGMGDTLHSEFRIMRKDGSPLWVFGSGNVAHSQDGNPSLIVVIMDIDEEKRLQLNQNENSSLYNQIINDIPNGIICTKDNDTLDIEYLSPSFLRLVGYTKSEIKSKCFNQFSKLIVKQDLDNLVFESLPTKSKDKFTNLVFGIHCKDGSTIQVEAFVAKMESSNSISRLCFSIVNVIDATLPSQKRTDIMKELYHQSDERSGNVLFEYSPQTNCAKFNKSFELMFGYTLPDDGMVNLDVILSSDRDKLYEALEIIQMSGHCDPIQIKMLRSDHSEIWCEITLNIRNDVYRCESTISGKITNIDYKFREEEINTQNSQYDKLTRLLNKASLEKHISSLLTEKPDNIYALYILDVNNFTKINNTYGHFIGDIVLKTLALRLKNIFRESDIIGRVGGDEFMIFMKYDDNKHVLEDRCQRLIDYVCAPIKIQNYEPFNIHISIGVSTSHKGITFSELFNLADNALYRVKKSDNLSYCIAE
ncbi:MAG: diguanylate cyclase, partial [Coprobacillus sp.]